MITLRKSDDRGHANLGWLDTWHSFSFADYHDPRHMGFGALRVINDDRVAPGAGFATHGHREMEIITYVIDGAVEHADSTGSRAVVRAGEVQRMTAGTGIRHSEYNPSSSEELRLLQIWILPQVDGLRPGYQQAAFPRESKHNRLCLLAAPQPTGGALSVHQDVALYATILDPGRAVVHPLSAGRRAWVQVVDGALEVNGTAVGRGDGVAVEDEDEVRLTGAEAEGGEALVFDLA